MKIIRLTLPDWLHQQVRQLAESEGTSINQFITLVLAEKISTLLTEEYLGERAKRGSREKFQQALENIPDGELLNDDRLD